MDSTVSEEPNNNIKRVLNLVPYHINLWTPSSWLHLKGLNKNIAIVNTLIETKIIPMRSQVAKPLLLTHEWSMKR